MSPLFSNRGPLDPEIGPALGRPWHRPARSAAATHLARRSYSVLPRTAGRPSSARSRTGAARVKAPTPEEGGVCRLDIPALSETLRLRQVNVSEVIGGRVILIVTGPDNWGSAPYLSLRG